MQSTARIPQFDAVRGLAALTVFWYHAFEMQPISLGWLQSINHTPLRFFTDGPSAVLLFFVLSGLVLNLKYVDRAILPPGWVREFLINRVFRLYPAFWAAILFALVLRIFFAGPSFMSGVTGVLSPAWKQPLEPWGVLNLATMVGPKLNVGQIDPPMWSLAIEMRASLLFPLIIICLGCLRTWSMDLLFLAMAYIGYLVFGSFTLQYLPYFILGAICAKHLKWLHPLLGRFNLFQQTLWLIGSLLLFQIIATDAAPAPAEVTMNYICRQLVGWGALGIILAAASFKGMAACLATKPFEFIGKTSYSFYLVHMLYLFTAVPWVYRQTHSWVLAWLTALALSYATAWLMYRFIEKPMIKKGHAFAVRWVSGQKTVNGATA